LPFEQVRLGPLIQMNVDPMNCEQFIERLSALRGELLDLKAQKHCGECPACSELFEIAQRLERESTAPDSSTNVETSELVERIRHAAVSRRRRTQGIIALAGCIALVTGLVLGRSALNQHRPASSDDALKTNVANGDTSPTESSKNPEIPSATALVKTELPVDKVDGGSRHARKAVMRLLDKTGKVHEVPVLVVSTPQQKIRFDELSPLERQVVRRYLELQGVRDAVISL
jgi:hypothetical protein